MLATTSFALDCGSPERLKRCFPRALRAFRRQYSVNYKRLLEESRKEAKFQIAETNLSVRIISLQRLRERRALLDAHRRGPRGRVALRRGRRLALVLPRPGPRARRLPPAARLLRRRRAVRGLSLIHI